MFKIVNQTCNTSICIQNGMTTTTLQYKSTDIESSKLPGLVHEASSVTTDVKLEPERGCDVALFDGPASALSLSDGTIAFLVFLPFAFFMIGISSASAHQDNDFAMLMF
jgi:hypothetical protein